MGPYTGYNNKMSKKPVNKNYQSCRCLQPALKLLQQSCRVLQQKPISLTIDSLTINAKRVIKKNTEMNQGRSQCKRYYGVLCKSRIPNKDNHLKDSFLKRQCSQTRDMWRTLLYPSFHTYLNNLHKFKLNVNCHITSIKELHTIANYNKYHKQCKRYHFSELLNVGNSIVCWQQIEKRGMKSGHENEDSNGDESLYPLDKLQKFVSLPLLSEKDGIFRPSKQEIDQAQKMFVSAPNNNIQFLTSAKFEDQLPNYDLPEVAFIGRSNVGKSSLIGMLLNDTDVLVYNSKNPGHTKLLNFFQIGKKFTLVDMPGYGYNMPKYYSESVEKFLDSRKKLSRTFIILDSSVGVTENDVIGLNMLEDFRIPYVVVLTKIDKTRPAVLLKSFMSVLNYRDKTPHCFSQPFLVSSKTGEGVPLLQTFIAYVTGNIKLKGL